jgi:hypothetical protein
MVDFCESYSPFHVCLTIRPFAHFVYATSHLSFVAFYSYLVSIREIGILCTCSDHGQPRYQIWIKCDKRQMTSCVILYRFHGWLIFVRVIALFMFLWPYVRPHILCTQLVICLLSHLIHIWYLGWPWSEHAHIAKINHPWNRYNMRMLRSWSIKIPNMNKMRQKTND